MGGLGVRLGVQFVHEHKKNCELFILNLFFDIFSTNFIFIFIESYKTCKKILKIGAKNVFALTLMNIFFACASDDSKKTNFLKENVSEICFTHLSIF